jgi:hypothetical protein
MDDGVVWYGMSGEGKEDETSHLSASPLRPVVGTLSTLTVWSFLSFSFAFSFPTLTHSLIFDFSPLLS